tara:strand:- start:589 stop:1071 length:483 start_codon:yes stop_codon:yes gene_type:complete
MARTGVIDIYLVYQFLRRLATPFEKWDAYKTGVIDKEGKILVDKRKRTPEQDRSFKVFDVMILKLKRLLGKIPGGKSRIASYAAALWLVKEWDETKSEDDVLEESIDLSPYMVEAVNNKIGEEIANVTGTGVVGTGDDPVHWRKKKKKEVLKRFNVNLAN